MPGLIAPTNMMTPPIGKVIKISQGNTPKVLLPSFNASPIKTDAISGMRIGRNPNIKPPKTINNRRFMGPRRGGVRGLDGGGNFEGTFSSDISILCILILLQRVMVTPVATTARNRIPNFYVDRKTVLTLIVC